MFIVAMKRGNARGAKGHRKMDAAASARRTPPPPECPEHDSGLNPGGASPKHVLGFKAMRGPSCMLADASRRSILDVVTAGVSFELARGAAINPL